jgi:hypothetical protein
MPADERSRGLPIVQRDGTVVNKCRIDVLPKAYTTNILTARDVTSGIGRDGVHPASP